MHAIIYHLLLQMIINLFSHSCRIFFMFTFSSVSFAEKKRDLKKTKFHFCLENAVAVHDTAALNMPRLCQVR